MFECCRNIPFRGSLVQKKECMKIDQSDLLIPADVPLHAQNDFRDNYQLIVKTTGIPFLFAAHDALLQQCTDAHKLIANPEILFQIADGGFVGALEISPSLIARYGTQYEKLTFIARLTLTTSPSNSQAIFHAVDSVDAPLMTIEQLILFKEESKLLIAGISVGIHFGTQCTPETISYICQTIYQAHQYGLPVFLSMYVLHTSYEHTAIDPFNYLLGIALNVGADFINITWYGPDNNVTTARQKIITRTHDGIKYISSGGPLCDPKTLFEEIRLQLDSKRSAGFAIGRNIFLRPLTQAIAVTKAIRALIDQEISPDEALELFNKTS